MSDTVIRVENLGKLYQIGTVRDKSDGLRHAVEDGVRRFSNRLRGRVDPQPASEDFWALKDVSFEVKRGECVGVIGRNGAGKSTLLKILSRITEPTTGEIGLKGRVGSLLEVGTGFHPELTGRENIFLNGAVLGMARKEIVRKFDEIVAFSEVEKFLDTPVKRYSSGMYVRLAFAVAAHLEPEILIVDEVLAVGDAQFQKKCLGKIGEVTSHGRTVIFVSHNIETVLALCKKAALMQNGRLCYFGNSESAVVEYLSDAAISTTGKYDLTNNPARSREHKCWIKSITILREDGVATSTVFSRKPFIVDLNISVFHELPEARIAIAIEDNLGRRILAVGNYLSQSVKTTLTQDCVVRCMIPDLRLGGGRYLISASIASKVNGMLDSVDGAAWFDVDATNCYQNSEAYARIYGPVLEDSVWTLA